MARWWLRIGALALTVFVVGCDELASKPDAKQKGPEAGSKSIDNMRGAAGIAPPEGLQ